jgi:hypothetical protein
VSTGRGDLHARNLSSSSSPAAVAMDLFVAPTIGFDLLYVLVIIRLERRNLQRHTTSDRGMDRTSGHRGIPLG